VLKQIDKLGIKVIIATGRSYSSASIKIKDLNLDQPVICFNGSMVRNGKTHQIIEHSTLSTRESWELIKISREAGIHFHGFLDEEFLYEIEGEGARIYRDVSGLTGKCIKFDDYTELPLTKGMFVAENSILLELEKKLKAKFGKDLYITLSKPTFLEVMNPSASKANALERLIKSLNIKREEVLAFGDGPNDEELLEFAGRGIVMKNGHQSLKDKYEILNYTNQEDGVAKFLQKHFLD
jgi:Cof subfamily protein (haloacid dehalogenase superfamily)